MERMATLEAVDCQSQVGSGALPNQLLPSAGIAIRLKNKKSRNGFFLSKVSEVFRKLPIPIIGRVHDNAFILDLRNLENESAFLKQLEFLPKNWDF
jgi:L-seryl-tRNA(Ser) seleniumtransferase